jgi:hypothetical protein
MRPTPLSFAGGLALILEKGSDGKFLAKSTSWIENRAFLPADLLGVSLDEEGFPGGPRDR